MEKLFQNVNIPENITHIKIDVGLGMSNVQSVNWLKNESNLFIFMFDPNTDSIHGSLDYMEQYKGIFNNNNNSFHIIPVALSNVEEEQNLDFYSMKNDGGTSSLYKPIDQGLGPVKNKSTVKVYSLKQFFDLFPWNRFEYIDYIKIDAQGADLDIIKSAGDYLKDRVVYITAEPEDTQYENCNHNTSKNMEEYLLLQNFIKINHPNTSDPTFINKKFMELKDRIYIFQS